MTQKDIRYATGAIASSDGTRFDTTARLKAIAEAGDVVYKNFNSGAINLPEFDKQMTRLENDRAAVEQEKRNSKAAQKWAGSADSTPSQPTYSGNQYGERPVDALKAFDPQNQADRKVAVRKWRLPSVKDMTQSQLTSMFEAGRSDMKFKTSIGVRTKDAGSWMGGDSGSFINRAGMKDWVPPIAIAEGTPGSLIPPELLPSAFWLRYEPVRLLEYFIGQRGTLQSVQWLQHYGNTAPASVVAELALKPDLGPLVQAKTATFSTIAATASISKQMYDDFSDWASTVPHEIQAAVIDAENDEVINGDGTGAHMLGLLHQTTLTRVSPTITGVDETAIDILSKAITDIRMATNAFAEADLIILHPEDWDNIRRIKNTLGSFVLSADRAMDLGEVDNLFGVPVVVTTKCPLGTGIVLDTKIAVLAFLRMGMEILFNPYGEWAFSHNAVQFRGEERLTIGVAYPNAINVVTNLNYYNAGLWAS